MSKLWLVARKELMMTAGTKSYVITTVAAPFLMAAFIAVLVLLGENLSDNRTAVEGRSLAFVAAGPLLPAIREELAAPGVAVEEASAEAGLADRVRAGELDGYVVFPDQRLGPEGPRFVTDDIANLALREAVSVAIGRTVVRQRLANEGLDAERIGTLTRRPRLQVRALADEGEVEQDWTGVFFTVIAFVVLLYMTILLYGQALGRAILTEKTGKTVEIMLSSLPPTALLAGKLLGKGLAGLIQVCVWVLIGIVVIELLGPRLDLPVPPLVRVETLAALVGFFVLGFLLYSTAFAMAGAIAADEQNFSQLLWPVIVILMLPMILMSGLLTAADGPLAVVLSLFPATAPVVMFMRVILGEPGPLQVVVSVAGMVLVTVIAVWAAAKVFRLGILLSGSKGSLGEIVRLLRA